MNWYKTDDKLIALNKEFSYKIIIRYEDNVINKTNIQIDNLELFDDSITTTKNYYIGIYNNNFNMNHSYDFLNLLHNAKSIIPIYCDYFLIDKTIYNIGFNAKKINISEMFNLMSQEQIIKSLCDFISTNDGKYIKLFKKWMKDTKKNYMNELMKSIKEINEKVNILEKHIYFESNIQNNDDNTINSLNDNITTSIINKLSKINTHLEWQPQGMGYLKAKKSFEESQNK